MHLHYSVKPVCSFCKPVCSYLRMNLVVGAYVGCGLVRTFLDIFGQCCNCQLIFASIKRKLR